MAVQYLVTCECGAHVPVEAGLAGDRLACQCGRTLEAPPLRELRKLPVAPAEASRPTGWGAPQAWVASGIIAAMIAVGFGCYGWWQLRSLRKLTDVALAANVQQFEEMTPQRAWFLWHQRIVPMARHGLEAFQTPDSFAHAEARKKYQWFQWVSFSAAGLAMVLAMGGAAWSRQKQRAGG